MARKRILIIDDEEDLCTILKVFLERIAKMEALTVQSGHEGLSLAERELPDAILLNVVMFDISGIEVFRELKNNPQTQDIPVIFLTAKLDRPTLNRLKELDAAGIISKPFDPKKFLDEMNSILDWN
ncbi:MAG: response regulator [Fischerella sp. CENA71]|nr:response regulator [Fischerella sp. CENA71]